MRREFCPCCSPRRRPATPIVARSHPDDHHAKHPVVNVEKKRRYSNDIYIYTMLMHNLSQAEMQ